MTFFEHQRTNPQRAIDEYKESMAKKHHASIDIWANELKKDYPIVKLGQGRDPAETDQYIEIAFVSVCVVAALSAVIYLSYLAGGWQ